MVSRGFNASDLYVFYNSLDYDKHIKIRDFHQHIERSVAFSFFKSPLLPTILFVGRLTEEKSLELLIDAMSLINLDNVKFNLIIIGDGPRFDRLQLKAKTGLENGWVHFTGALYNEISLGNYIVSSDLCVSPGNVGLTAIHSLSLGTPVCTHGNMTNQMPEAESIRNGYNGFYFQEGNIESLVNGIKNWFSAGVDRNDIRRRCFEVIDTFYNPYYQLNVIDSILKKIPPEI
jgi:glycosyltransferase involved in cell wall biosynthesis